jgi:hypothetical protein
MDWWEERRRKLRRQLAANVTTTLLTTSMLVTGIRDHYLPATIIGVVGVLVGPWVTFSTWRDIREHNMKV